MEELKFTIEDGRRAFWQWDTGCRIVLTGGDCPQVHFSPGDGEAALCCAVYERDGRQVADVPGQVLRRPGRLQVYGYVPKKDGGYTKYTAIFPVQPRPRPEDDIHTEPQIKTWQALEDRLEALEEQGVGGEQIRQAVEEALDAAKESGAFKGEPGEPGKDGQAGKSAYAYARDGGYTGTEEQFAAKLAIDPEWMATKEHSGGDTVYIAEQTLTSGFWTKLQSSFQPDLPYDVYINGEVYTCVARANGQGVSLGNDAAMSLNDYPFCIEWAGGTAVSGMFLRDSTVLSYPITLKVTDHEAAVYNKMPVGYLPDEAALKSEIRQPLIGSTAQITPAQVAEALTEGRSVVIGHDDAQYGTFIFNAFEICTKFNAVQSSGVFYNGGTYFAALLTGDVFGDSWSVLSEPLLMANSAAEAYIQSLIDAKLGVIENGAY